ISVCVDENLSAEQAPRVSLRSTQATQSSAPRNKEFAKTVMTKKKMCLALQGGGSHGAFTWGVLDGLLVEESLEIEAVSGTSAGAMNGAILVDALKRGGRQHARERLERFWRSISEAGDNIFKPGRMLLPAFANSDWSPIALWSDVLSL